MNLATDLARMLRTYFLPMVGAVAIIWALWIGFQFFKADNEGARNNAKKRLLSAVSVVMIISLLVGLLGFVKLDFPANNDTPPSPSPTPGPNGGGGGGGGGNWTMATGSGTGTGTRTAVKGKWDKYGLINPVKFCGAGLDDETSRETHGVPSCADWRDGYLVAESITGAFGTRRLSSIDDMEYYLDYLKEGVYGLKANAKGTGKGISEAGTKLTNVPAGRAGRAQKLETAKRQLLRGEAPGFLEPGDGLFEHNFGVEINTLDGEGLARYTTIYPQSPIGIATDSQNKGDFGSSTAQYAGNDMLAVKIDVKFEPIDLFDADKYPNELVNTNKTNYEWSTMSRTRTDRMNGVIPENIVSMWQNPLQVLLKDDKPLAAFTDGRRIMSSARAVADGIVVACGNTETDSPYENAWVLIKHAKPLSGYTESYSYYGGLYGAVKMHDEFVKVYRTLPDAYEPIKVSESVFTTETTANVTWPGPGNSSTVFGGGTYTNQFGLNAPIYDKPFDNFGPGYFTYDGVVFENPNVSGNRQPDAKDFETKYGKTFKLLTNDGDGSNYDKDHPYIPKPEKKYWFPTSVFNEFFELDYNGTVDSDGYYENHGTYDENLIGKRVKQGDFIGYVGGGILDPGAGTKKGSYYSKYKKDANGEYEVDDDDNYILLDPIWDFGPNARNKNKYNLWHKADELKPNFYDYDDEAYGDYKEKLSEIIKDTNDRIRDYNEAVEKFIDAWNSTQSAGAAPTTDNMTENDKYNLFDPDEKDADTYPIFLTPRTVGVPQMIGDKNYVDILGGINSKTERHLQFEIYCKDNPDYNRDYGNSGSKRDEMDKLINAAKVKKTNDNFEITFESGVEDKWIKTVDNLLLPSELRETIHGGRVTKYDSPDKEIPVKSIKGDAINPATFYDYITGKRGRPTVALSAGHGAPQKDGKDEVDTGGAIYWPQKDTYYAEQEAVLGMALEVGFDLREHRVNVIQTRPDGTSTIQYAQRAAMAIGSGADVYFSFHRDGGKGDYMHIIVQTQIPDTGKIPPPSVPFDMQQPAWNIVHKVKEITEEEDGPKAPKVRNVGTDIIDGVGIRDKGRGQGTVGEVNACVKYMGAMLFELGYTDNVSHTEWFEAKHDLIAKTIANGLIADGAMNWKELKLELPQNLVAKNGYEFKTNIGQLIEGAQYQRAELVRYTKMKGKFMERTLDTKDGFKGATNDNYNNNENEMEFVTADSVGGEIMRGAESFGGAASILGVDDGAKGLANMLKIYVFPFAAAGAILWTLWIGIQFGRADNEQLRGAAKSRLIKALFTVIIIGVLWALLFAIGEGKLGA